MTERANRPPRTGRRFRHWTAAILVVLMFVALGCVGATDSGSEQLAGTPLPTVTATPRAGSTPEATLPPADSPTPEQTEEPTEGEIGPLFGDVPIDDPAARATIAAQECPFDLPEGTTPTCSLVTVPENWWDPSDTNTVALTVAVFEATEPDPAPDPVIYLEGGPGGHALDLLFLNYDSFYGELARSRDVILFDQRGAGFSDPQLACPEIDEVFSEERTTVRSEAEEKELALEAVGSCRDRLTKSGIEIGQYHSAASATDLEAIRGLLGYDQWNLLGISYGTRLAQSAMRLYPTGIRSVVLDAVVPAADDRPSIFAPNAQRAFERLFAGCESNEPCAAAYPDFENRFFAVIDAWNESPVSFEGVNPLTGDGIDFVFSGDDLLQLTFGSLYSRSSFAAIPQVVAEAEAGEFGAVSTIAAVNVAQSAFSTAGVYLSVECVEEDPFSDETLVVDLTPKDPYYASFADNFNGSLQFDVCDLWDVNPVDASENEVVESSIPTLLLAGGFDPITPPSALDGVAAGLSASYSVVFPDEGHGVSPSECGLTLVGAFLTDPEQAPNDSCVADSPPPRWTSDPDAPITLVDFAVDDLAASVRSVRPDGWIDQGNGVFARYDNIVDPALLLVQNSFGMSPAALLPLLANLLGWDGPPEKVETRQSNGVDWEIYRGDYQTSSVAVAVSDQGADSLVILVSGHPSDFPRFEQEIFDPAVAATVPN